MRFWDTSALVPMLVDEVRSEAVARLLAEDPRITVWWATEVECASPIGRQERRAGLDPESAQAAFERLDLLAGSWDEVQPNSGLRRTARRLVRVHELRAADAFQLAAALDAAEGRPGTSSFVTADERLALAARREGFTVIVPEVPAP